MKTKKTFQISKQAVNELLEVIEISKQAKLVGEIKTYSGDAPTFMIEAYPNSQLKFEIKAYSDGKEVKESATAHRLAREAAQICKMGGTRFLWKHLFSKIGM